MKPRILPLLLLAFFFVTGFHHLQTKPAFSYKVYGNFANYFESEADLLSFFEFNKGDVVAEIGANTGQNIGGLLILTDSITFYAQDIDATALNKKKFDKIIKHTQKYKKPISGQYKLCIGTEKSTNLPDATFDKIFLSATFHEFTFMDEMLEDIS